MLLVLSVLDVASNLVAGVAWTLSVYAFASVEVMDRVLPTESAHTEATAAYFIILWVVVAAASLYDGLLFIVDHSAS